MVVEYVPTTCSTSRSGNCLTVTRHGGAVAQVARRSGKIQGSMYSRIQASDADPAHDPDAGCATSHDQESRGDLRGLARVTRCANPLWG